MTVVAAMSSVPLILTMPPSVAVARHKVGTVVIKLQCNIALLHALLIAQNICKRITQ